jgi:hypothetical protein
VAVSHRRAIVVRLGKPLRRGRYVIAAHGRASGRTVRAKRRLAVG